MPLVPLRRVLNKAMNNSYAVGHFNIENLETVQAVADAAVMKRSPVIMAASESEVKYANVDYLVSLVRAAAKNAKVPIVLHLDHGKDMEMIKRCILAGFTSIMVDASAHDFKTNVKITKKVVSMCKPKGISVEAELGHLAKEHSAKTPFTDPKQAREFVKLTGVDALAIAIGTSHGAYKFAGASKLDLKRLKEIDDLVDIPLVLHGASEIPKTLVNKGIKYGAKWHGAHGVSIASLRKACRSGIDKVNIHSDLNMIRVAAMREYLTKNPEVNDPRPIQKFAQSEMTRFIAKKMDILGSSDKA